MMPLLPPLPPADVWPMYAGIDDPGAYSADQMHAYGAACAAASSEQLRVALQHIIRVMGPKAPPCCDGCAFEWHEALTTARAALKDKP